MSIAIPASAATTPTIRVVCDFGADAVVVVVDAIAAAEGVVDDDGGVEAVGEGDEEEGGDCVGLSLRVGERSWRPFH